MGSPVAERFSYAQMGYVSWCTPAVADVPVETLVRAVAHTLGEPIESAARLASVA